MKALAASLLLATSALAADDAPGAVVLQKGDVVTEAGTFLPTPLDVQQANRTKVAEARPGYPVVLLVGAVGLVVGAVVGGVVAAYAIKR